MDGILPTPGQPHLALIGRSAMPLTLRIDGLHDTTTTARATTAPSGAMMRME
jgi:hypothetical protein